MRINISGNATINGHKAEPCPKCGARAVFPNKDRVYRVPGMTPDETKRCLTCGYVEREGTK